MKNLISFKVATNLSLVIFSLLALFHLAIIIGIVLFHYAPIEFLWGGRMETKNQLLGFEFISFFVTTLSIMAVLIHSNRTKAPKLKNTARICLWVLFIIFVLNTLGNALAETSFEKSFSIVTAILAILCLRQAIESRKNDQ
ncbi:hypothetical protein AWW67_06750 [Roseivirga seohaensis]|uniref:Uncharacterized protein n=1 Tax=Roseivirga seohaensis TaxID=1914963 RepID=A0A150XWW3_9BACT|nr:hypothetical protein [Roseivirga seohaensis]KYG83115.1 hypothetical protein AWW67_06750 [Roseivirga seohaensis]